MSHILHPKNQTQTRVYAYAKWRAISKQVVYPDRYAQANHTNTNKTIIK